MAICHTWTQKSKHQINCRTQKTIPKMLFGRTIGSFMGNAKIDQQ